MNSVQKKTYDRNAREKVLIYEAIYELITTRNADVGSKFCGEMSGVLDTDKKVVNELLKTHAMPSTAAIKKRIKSYFDVQHEYLRDMQETTLKMFNDKNF
jgi:hypothetical protein